MATSKIKKINTDYIKDIRLGWTQVYIPANSDHVAISASVHSGYQFLCWVGSASRGSVKSSYIELVDQPDTVLWVENKTNSTRMFVGYFLSYLK